MNTSYKDFAAMKKHVGIAGFTIMLIMGGCTSHAPFNSSFPVTIKQAEAARHQMQAAPKPLARPVVVLSGILDPGLISQTLAIHLRRITGEQRIISVAFPGSMTFEACRAKVIDRVERAFASTDSGWTTEVDVVAISMGGIVARFAALQGDANRRPARRLRIANLYTISTPHRGARLAALPTFDQRRVDMRSGSDLLQRLDAALPAARYTLYPYVRLGDLVVGAANAAPPGSTAWWLPNPPLALAHAGAYSDPRIVTDIVRRLRGEPPWTISPPAPLPVAGTSP
jgi:hypothetical protein